MVQKPKGRGKNNKKAKVGLYWALVRLDHHSHQTHLGCKMIKNMRDNKNETYDVGVISHRKEQTRGEKVH